MVDINVRPRPKALWVLASDRRWRIRDIQGFDLLAERRLLIQIPDTRPCFADSLLPTDVDIQEHFYIIQTNL